MPIAQRLLTAIAVAVLMGPSAASAQEPAPAAPGAVPRDARGRADLSGVWMRSETVRIGNEAPPYNAEALARHQEFRKALGAADPSGRCLVGGVPRSYTFPAPFRIVQLPDEVIMLFEFFRGVRLIPTDGRPHPDEEPQFMGTAVGRWEGDTLVIDVRNFNDKTWLGNGATHHSDQLRVTERLTRTAPDSFSYEATVVDPIVFTQPWTIRHVFELRPGDRIREYECEDNAPQ